MEGNFIKSQNIKKIVYIIGLCFGLLAIVLSLAAIKYTEEYIMIAIGCMAGMLSITLCSFKLIGIKIIIGKKKFNLFFTYEFARLLGMIFFILVIVYELDFFDKPMPLIIATIVGVPLLIYYFIKHIIRCWRYYKEYKATGRVTVDEKYL